MTDSLIGLGRRHAPDDRDKAYLLQAPRKTSAPTSRTWTSFGVLDQGATSMCVAYAGTKYLTSSPIRNKPPMPPADLYRQAQLVDEWPGEDPDSGTSVRALFKVLKRIGYVKEYRWAYDVETLVQQVLGVGPVVCGTNWYYDMMDPDRWGYIQPTGSSMGGHAWLIIGASRTRVNPDKTFGAVRMINSWGPNWGPQNGRAWITFRDLAKLLNEDGEACVATEILVA